MGCPCPEYACPGARTSILILYGRNPSSIPVITDATGKVNYAGQDFTFELSKDTEVYQSCSITYHGNFYVFGRLDQTS